MIISWIGFVVKRAILSMQGFDPKTSTIPLPLYNCMARLVVSAVCFLLSIISHLHSSAISWVSIRLFPHCLVDGNAFNWQVAHKVQFFPDKSSSDSAFKQEKAQEGREAPDVRRIKCKHTIAIIDFNVIPSHVLLCMRQWIVCESARVWWGIYTVNVR